MAEHSLLLYFMKVFNSVTKNEKKFYLKKNGSSKWGIQPTTKRDIYRALSFILLNIL